MSTTGTAMAAHGPRRSLLVAFALLVAVTPACGGIDDAAPGIELGVVVTTWTINGSRDPITCLDSGVERLRLVVTDPFGGVRANTIARCEAFATRASVRAGLYSATATFIDDADQPISATLALPVFAVDGNETTSVPIAFTSANLIARPKDLLPPR